VSGSADDSLERAEELLARLEATRAEVERLTSEDDAEKVIEVLGQLHALAQEVQEELEKAKRASEADAGA
jgi:hypothetical protein